MVRVGLILLILAAFLPISAAAQESDPHDCIVAYENVASVGLIEIKVFDLETNTMFVPEQPTSAYMPDAVFSPDGTYAAFLWPNDLDEEGRSYIGDSGMVFYVENVETGDLTLILPEVNGYNPVSPTLMAWSPDGEKIALMDSEITDSGLEPFLFTANRDGSDPLTTALTVEESLPLWENRMLWSEDGQYIFVGSVAWYAVDHAAVPEGSIPIMPTPTSTTLTPIPVFETPDLSVEGVDNLTLISVAPDQKTEVFQFSNDDQSEGGLIVYNPALEVAGLLKIDGGHPVWSTDGSRLAFLRWADGYHIVVEVLNVREFKFTHIATVENNSHEYYGTIMWTQC